MIEDVVQIVTHLRSLATAHPLLCVLACSALAALAPKPVRGDRLRVFRTVGVSILLLTYAVLVLWYVHVPQYSDHAEPGIAAVSWVVANGGTPYPAPLSAEQYAFPYGPLLYLANAFVLGILGPNLWSSKVAGVLSAGLSVALVAVACRRTGRSATAGLAWCVIGYLAFGTASFWTRPEPLLLLTTALAIATLTGPLWAACIGLGIALGAGVAIKVTAPIYLIPALAVFWHRHGFKWLALAVVTGVAVLAVPFVVAPRLHFGDYLYWIGSAARHGMRWRSVPSALEWALALSLPSAVSLWYAHGTGRFPSQDRDVDIGRIALGACLVGTFLLAAKRGTGPHHFLPFVPTLAWLEADLFRDTRRRAVVAVGFAIAGLLVACLQQAYWIVPVAAAANPEAVAELRQFERAYRGPVAVGYSAGYRLSYLRPLPVFDGQPYQLDAVALMDARLSGDVAPPSVVDSIRVCRFNVWLIPATGEPFSIMSAYDARVAVFDRAFVREFNARYQLRQRGSYFNVWICRR
jgi:4-amino-4-deoxy-L-arabinose transferase-like glycosyltransferase